MSDELPKPTKFMRFQETSANSLLGHLMLLSKEMMEKSWSATDPNESFWYKDSAALIREVAWRYEELEREKEFTVNGSINGWKPKQPSER